MNSDLKRLGSLLEYDFTGEREDDLLDDIDVADDEDTSDDDP